MAAVLPPSSVHSSSHLFAPHRDTFTAFHHGSAAFAPHPHYNSSAKSRSVAASWRHFEPQAVTRAPAPVDTTSLKSRRSRPSHSRTASASSEASSTSWRLHIRSPTVTRVNVKEEPSGPHQLRASSPFVYSVAELLHLSASPAVGISRESQDIVDDLVAHYVWRRGAQSGKGQRRNNRGTSGPRSLHTSTDDSEHSD